MKQKQVEEEEAGASSESHGSPPPPHSAARESVAAAAGGGSSSTEQGGSFDCNICLELAQDPVVTLCGHLFCWPCLYRWLQMHSVCQECPVCKASVEEEKVIPLYGRGKIGSADPRTKTVPGVNNIPHRPAGQRPDTARHHTHEHQHQHHAFNFTAGIPPVAGPATTARFGNIALSASFGLFPSLFGFQLQGFPDATSMGGSHGIHHVGGAAAGLAASQSPSTSGGSNWRPTAGGPSFSATSPPGLLCSRLPPHLLIPPAALYSQRSKKNCPA